MTIRPYEWQKPLVDHAVGVLRNPENFLAINASETGVGKSICALSAAAELGLVPLVITPKAVITQMKNVAKEMGVEIIDAINLEKIKTGKTPYFTKVGKQFVCNLDPSKHMILADEAHKCSGRGTQNANILTATQQLIKRGGVVMPFKIKTLAMSATIADTPMKFANFARLLGMCTKQTEYQWLIQHGAYRSKWGGLDFPKGKSKLRHLAKLRAAVFPEYGIKLTKAEIPGFPDGKLFVELYDVDPTACKAIESAYNDLETKEADASMKGNSLTELLRARQKCEYAKVPLLEDLVKDHLENGMSVVVFMNFTDSLTLLKDRLRELNPAIIVGGQSEKVRTTEMRRFQDNFTRVCIANVAAGGVGVDLHDVHGGHPRVSLICPPVSAVDFTQACGRIHRATGKSKAVQYLVLAANTKEQHIKKLLDNKLENLSLITDGDLSGL